MKEMIRLDEKEELIVRLKSVREKRVAMGEIREAKNLKNL